MKKVKTGLLLLAAMLILSFPLQAAASEVSDGQWIPESGDPKNPDVPESREPGLPESEEPGLPESEEPGFPGSGESGFPESGEPVFPETGAPGFPESEEPGIPETGKSGNILPIICIIGVVAAAVIAFAAVFSVSRRKGKSDSNKSRSSGRANSGIPVKLEIYSGKCRNKSALLRLSDSLLVGSSADCDIIFDEPEVAAKNSLIKLVDGQVYIEDLNSPRGTAIDGMRFQGSNKLRGGEVISIGSVEFSILWENSSFLSQAQNSGN